MRIPGVVTLAALVASLAFGSAAHAQSGPPVPSAPAPGQGKKGAEDTGKVPDYTRNLLKALDSIDPDVLLPPSPNLERIVGKTKPKPLQPFNLGKYRSLVYAQEEIIRKSGNDWITAYLFGDVDAVQEHAMKYQEAERTLIGYARATVGSVVFANPGQRAMVDKNARLQGTPSFDKLLDELEKYADVPGWYMVFTDNPDDLSLPQLERLSDGMSRWGKITTRREVDAVIVERGGTVY